MSRPRLAVHPASGPTDGAGHLVRTLALSQAWIDGGGVVVAAIDPRSPWAQRYRNEPGIEVVADSSVASSDHRAAHDGLAADVTLTDGYDLSLPTADRPCVVIDDFGLSGDRGPVDLLVDQNGGDTSAPYQRAERLLSGPRYALLRRQFRDVPPRVLPLRDASDPVVASAPTILVSIGGLPDSAARSWAAEVERQLGAVGRVIRLDGVDDVAGLLATIDAAVAASGSTTWELLRCGVPAVYVALTHNQELVLDRIAALDAGRSLGPMAMVDPVDAAEAVRACIEHRVAPPSIVDGRGAIRVATAVRGLLVSLRPVEGRDRDRLLAWANDPATRASARHVAPITDVEHDEWFRRRLASLDPWFIGMLEGRAIGQFRVDLEDGGRTGEIDVSIAPEYRGRGWAAPLIDAGSAAALVAAPNMWTLEAVVRSENERSQRAFSSADFDLVRHAGRVTGDTEYLTYHRRGNDDVEEDSDDARRG